MTQTSILQLSDKELREQFGTHVSFYQLKGNVDRYKAEIGDILSSTDLLTLRPLLKKLFKIRSRVHKGDIFRAFGDEKGQIAQYGGVRKGRKGFSEAQRRLFDIGLSSSDGFSQVARCIKEVSISNGEFVFQKGYPFSLIELGLQDVGIRRGGSLDDDIPYVVSLSQNENGMQEGKLSFFAIPHKSIDDGTYDGTFVNLEDLDAYFHPKNIIFRGVDTSGNLVFSQVGRRKKILIPSDKILNGFRKKDTLINDNETEPIIVWEEGREYVNIIQYGENHPQKILQNIRSDLEYGLIGDASDLLYRLKEGTPEYTIARQLIDDEASEQGEIISGMIDRGEFPTG